MSIWLPTIAYPNGSESSPAMITTAAAVALTASDKPLSPNCQKPSKARRSIEASACISGLSSTHVGWGPGSVTVPSERSMMSRWIWSA